MAAGLRIKRVRDTVRGSGIDRVITTYFQRDGVLGVVFDIDDAPLAWLERRRPLTACRRPLTSPEKII